MKDGDDCASDAGVIDFLMQEQTIIYGLLHDWMAEHRVMWRAQVAEQERLITALSCARSDSLEQLQRLKHKQRSASQVVKDKDATSDFPKNALEKGLIAEEDLTKEPLEMEIAVSSAATMEPDKLTGTSSPCTPPQASDPNGLTAVTAESVLPEQAAPVSFADLKEAVGLCERDVAVLRNWIRCDGLHTVHDWIQDYHNHPSGWGALLAIHGVPETTSRLRNKVDNYAIYSSLFLSATIALVANPIPYMQDACKSDSTWSCATRLRLYVYGCFASITFHTLSVILAVVFNNALNETARDADVFRMFARGKGFRATQLCEQAFFIGVICNYVALSGVASLFVSLPEVLTGTIVFWTITFVTVRHTYKLLFQNGSIIGYWRSKKGGKLGQSDPYILDVPMQLMQHRADAEEIVRKLREAGSFYAEKRPVAVMPQ